MRSVLFAMAMALAVTLVAAAESQQEHAYKKAASVHDLMEYMVKPAMDKIKAFGEGWRPVGQGRMAEGLRGRFHGQRGLSARPDGRQGEG